MEPNYDQLDLENRFLSCCINTEDFQDKMEGLDRAEVYFTDIDNRSIFKHLLKAPKTGCDFDVYAFQAEVGRETVSLNDILRLYSLGQSTFHLKSYLETLRGGYMRQKTVSMIDYAKDILLTSKGNITEVLTGLIKHSENNIRLRRRRKDKNRRRML